MEYLSISELKNAYSKKQFSPAEYTQYVYEKAKKKNPILNAFININENYSNPVVGPLSGIPYSIKDIFCTKDMLTTAASMMLKNFIPPYNATVYDRASKTGANLIGKNNCDEFAQGTTGEYSAFGPTINPWDNSVVAGGTSSGSAAAVAADLSSFSICSDTGGSIRLPASYCGVAGLKPTYGMLSRYGQIAMASSLDCPGIIARSIADVEEVFSHLKGYDPKDHTSLSSENSSHELKKIGVPREYFTDQLDDNIRKLIENVISYYETIGCEVVDVDLPSTKYAISAYYILVPAEISSNLARYDGISYGGPLKDVSRQESIDEIRGELFGSEVKRRIVIGTFVLSEGYIDEYYNKAQLVRERISKEFRNVFETVDMLITPVANRTASKLGEYTSNPLAMYFEDLLTVPVSLAGLPAVSIPAGMSNGLPVGVQLISKWGNDTNLLNWAELYEKDHEWYKLHPGEV